MLLPRVSSLLTFSFFLSFFPFSDTSQENEFDVAGSTILDRMKRMGSKMDGLERSISDMMIDAGLVDHNKETKEDRNNNNNNLMISPSPSMEYSNGENSERHEENTTISPSNNTKSNNKKNTSAVL
jgi:hypothetical protein